MRNELRFVGERFLRAKQLFPNHPANESIFRAIYQHVEQVQSIREDSKPDRKSTLFSDSDFEMIMRMFNQGSGEIESGTVLVEESDYPEGPPITEAHAYLVRLEGNNAVFLDSLSRISYVHFNDTITTGPPEALEPGDQLIIVNTAARESIAHRIMDAKRGEETNQSASQIIVRWQQELSDGIVVQRFSYIEILRKIQELGSKRLSPLVIKQWATGEILGPLDPRDILRIGQAIDSEWLKQNWQRIGAALLMVRSGHRLLGRRITRIIEKAAVGEYELKSQDEEFLHQIGITIGELQDAVTLLTVESVSKNGKAVPIERIGEVIPV
jgi:hypothetical protein